MKKLVLLGMAAFVLGACGNNAQDQVEADVDSSTVESSEEVAQESSEETGTGYVRQSTEDTLALLESIELGIANENPEIGPTYDEVVELLESEASRTIESDNEDGKSTAMWESPRQGTQLVATFENDHAVMIGLQNEKTTPITREQHKTIKTDGSLTLDQLVNEFGLPYSYAQTGQGGYNVAEVEYKEEGEEYSTFRVTLEDGVVTSIYPEADSDY